MPITSKEEEEVYILRRPADGINFGLGFPFLCSELATSGMSGIRPKLLLAHLCDILPPMGWQITTKFLKKN